MRDVEKQNPRVSFILLDWSVRESFHFLTYLNQQTVARDQYEIIWIEYYNRRAKEVEGLVDQWIVLETPEDLYYHKHVMYNVGLAKSRGEIVAICDSDVMVKPTFVQSIIESFEKEKEIVLHLDEVRNNNRRFYPFNFPTFDEVIGEGCINWKKGTTTGILERRDPLHKRNYGACFAARRDDLLAIGGADENNDYLGHICGPYEMTFRLMNAGKKEVWHESEFLYHTWHPGTDGRGNFLGPHDGKNVSSTALEARRSGRVMPLTENAAIRMIRTRATSVEYAMPLESLLPLRQMEQWKRSQLKSQSHLRLTWRAFVNPVKLIRMVELFGIALAQTWRQLFRKATNYTPSLVMKKTFMDHATLGFAFLRRMMMNNFYTIQACRQVLQNLVDNDVKSAAIYGKGPVAAILKSVARPMKMKLITVETASLKNFSGKIILANMDGDLDLISELEHNGITSDRIVRIQ